MSLLVSGNEIIYFPRMKLLPDRDAFFYRYIHRIFFRNAKCIIPCSNVRQRSVYTPFAQRVYIDLRQLQDGFGTGIVSPNIGISQEKRCSGVKPSFTSSGAAAVAFLNA